MSSAPGAQVTPNVIPTGYEFLTCLTENTVWTPPEDGFYRINVFGKCADGGNGQNGVYTFGGALTFRSGGYGGASGGFSRSLLSLSTNDRINCTVTDAITSFGDYLSATGATGQTGVGKGSGGNLFNLNGFSGGSPGASVNPSNGQAGGNNGGSGGVGFADPNPLSSGGGGGARIPVPEVDYDDPLYTTYTVTSLAQYRGGNAQVGYNQGSGYPGSSYPAFNPKSPVIYGGGNGGGGGHDNDSYSSYVKRGGKGSAGSPACIIIEKGVY